MLVTGANRTAVSFFTHFLQLVYALVTTRVLQPCIFNPGKEKADIEVWWKIDYFNKQGERSWQKKVGFLKKRCWPG